MSKSMYEFTLTEIYKRPFVVEADSEEEAWEIAQQMECDGDIEVDFSHFSRSYVDDIKLLTEQDIK